MGCGDSAVGVGVYDSTKAAGVLLFFVFPAEEITAKGICLGIGFDMQITFFKVTVKYTYKYFSFFFFCFYFFHSSDMGDGLGWGVQIS